MVQVPGGEQYAVAMKLTSIIILLFPCGMAEGLLAASSARLSAAHTAVAALLCSQ